CCARRLQPRGPDASAPCATRSRPVAERCRATRGLQCRRRFAGFH
ncbi:MAG: hypothetical protein AVDCRST_MAG71-1621, partial [uncultured Lysobacter sp.]